MKIKVIRSTSFQDWFKNRVGEEFEVAEDQNNQYAVKEYTEQGIAKTIPKYCCEITSTAPDLSGISDEDLIAELKKRGYEAVPATYL